MDQNDSERKERGGSVRGRNEMKQGGARAGGLDSLVLVVIAARST